MLTVLGTACARTVQTLPHGVGATFTVDEFLGDLAAEVLRADAHGEIPAGLYDSAAVVVTDGVERTGSPPPRFAGIEGQGEVAITASRTQMYPDYAWAYIEYRWISLAAGRVREGRATLILVRDPGPRGWRVMHVHSSSPRT